MRQYFSLLGLLFLVALSGCGGGSGSSGDSITNLTISPETATIKTGSSRAFIYSIQGTGSPDTSVVWSTDNPSADPIDNNGILSAKSSGVVHVTVKSVFDPTKTATATITVADAPPTLFLVDTSTQTGVPTLAQHFFITSTGATTNLGTLIKVSGNSDTRIDWQVLSTGGGTIDSSGRYTAPGPGGHGTYLIRYSAVADPTQIDYVYAVVREQQDVPAPTGAIVITAPKDINGNPITTLRIGRRYKFGYMLQVQGSNDASVTWSLRNAAGSPVGLPDFTTDGIFTPTATGTYTVTVTSNALLQAGAAKPGDSLSLTVVQP